MPGHSFSSFLMTLKVKLETQPPLERGFGKISLECFPPTHGLAPASQK